MTLYRTIQAGRRGILNLAFFAVRRSVKAPAATSYGHIRFMAGRGGTIGCGPAWTICATSSTKRSRAHKRSGATSCGVMGKPARSTTMPRERGGELQTQ